MGAAQAGPTFQLLVRDDTTVGQLIPAVSVKVLIGGLSAD